MHSIVPNQAGVPPQVSQIDGLLLPVTMLLSTLKGSLCQMAFYFFDQ